MVVVAAVDRSERAPSVIDQGAKLAEKFEEPLHVVHVMKRSEAIDAETASIRSDEGIELEELRGVAADVPSEVLAEHPVNVDTEIVGLIGDPANEIVEYAEQREAKYIVVSPRRRSQTGKMLFGSVAQSILLNTTCPVVSMMTQ